MKNVANKYKFILLAVMLFGCTEEFQDINRNPNDPQTATPNVLLPGIERDMMAALLTEVWEIGNTVIQHTAKNQFVNEDRYLWGERNRIWNAVYDNMRDVNNILLQAEKDNMPNYKAVALILRSWMFSLATDSYGDVPYSEAMKGKEGIFFATYDEQEKIYDGILADLEKANTLLVGAVNISGDIIYSGDVTKWRKLANSLRLRYLMRISDRKNVSDQLQAILDEPAANPIFGSNSDHAVYTYRSSSPDQFPLFSARIGSFNEFRASKTMTDKLLSCNDPRLSVFFRPTPETELTSDTSDDEYAGIPNGMNDVDALTFNGGPEFQSRVGKLFYEEANTAEGLQVAQGVIMTYAELQFILAEAREKGIITTGNAAEYYNNGIVASFNFYGLTPNPNYFTHSDVLYTGTTGEKLTKIGTQKWISLYFQGMEAWFDWRRTGYPALPLAVSAQADRIPVRFIYPISEQSLNSANRAAAVARQGEDGIITPVWWDVE